MSHRYERRDGRDHQDRRGREDRADSRTRRSRGDDRSSVSVDRRRRPEGRNRRARSRSLPYSSSSSDGGSVKRRPRQPPFHRYDSPPKESAVIANLHGLSDQPINALRAMREATTAADAVQQSLRSEQLKLAKELYVGNLPAGILISSLIDRINDVLISMGATTMAGKPIVSGWLGGEGQFAFLELRTVEECNNALSLNGYVLDGQSLKVGKPKGVQQGALGNGASAIAFGASFGGPATVFSLDDTPGLGLSVNPPIEESSKIEKLVLVGAPLRASLQELESVVSPFGELKSVELVSASSLDRTSLVFEFKDVADQRKCAHAAIGFSYDRDYPLAVVRVDEAVMRGFANIPNEQFSIGLNRKEGKTVPTRILWITNFPPIPFGQDAEFANELDRECAKFGTVRSLQLLKVDKSKIKPDEGYLSIAALAESNEMVAIVEFDDCATATKCRRYLTGGVCFFLNEDKFSRKDFAIFEVNRVPGAVATPTLQEDEKPSSVEAPRVHRGAVISAEVAIVAANKQKQRRPKIAPEDREIID